MHPRLAVPLIALAAGIPAFLLGRVIWSPAPSNPTPSEAQLPFFIVLALIEALLFGLGSPSSPTASRWSSRRPSAPA